MNDRELLELAAKGAGYHVLTNWAELGYLDPFEKVYVQLEDYGDYKLWDPLHEAGEAFQLAVAIRATVICARNHTACDVPGTDEWVSVEDVTQEAANRAVVLAAAELGSLSK